jgi:hypothetical protein
MCKYHDIQLCLVFSCDNWSTVSYGWTWWPSLNGVGHHWRGGDGVWRTLVLVHVEAQGPNLAVLQAVKDGVAVDEAPPAGRQRAGSAPAWRHQANVPTTRSERHSHIDASLILLGRCSAWSTD